MHIQQKQQTFFFSVSPAQEFMHAFTTLRYTLMMMAWYMFPSKSLGTRRTATKTAQKVKPKKKKWLPH